MREDHPLLLGMTGFWGTPIGNDKCRTADLILAVGTRLAEANSSSWDPRYTFAIPPTRLIHIDVDPAEIGRNFPTELGVVADAKLALERPVRGRARPGAPQARRLARRRSRRPGGPSPPTGASSGSPTSIPSGRSGSSASCARRCRRTASSSPTWAGTRTASASSSRSRFPGRSSRPSGLATMGFGPSAVLGVKVAQPQPGGGGAGRRRRLRRQSVGGGHGHGGRPGRGLGGDGQRGVRDHRRPGVHALRIDLRMHVRVRRRPVPRRLRGHGAGAWARGAR